MTPVFTNIVKPVLNEHSQKDQKLVFKTDSRLMQVKIIAECILQSFRTSLSYRTILSKLA